MRFSRLFLGSALVAGACGDNGAGTSATTDQASSTGSTGSTGPGATTGSTGSAETTAPTSTVGTTDATSGSGTTEAPGSTGTTGAVESTGDATTGPVVECGDGVLDVGEMCDGVDFGGKTCANVDPKKPAGMLVCSDDCQTIDASKCQPQAPMALMRLNEFTSEGAVAGEYMGKGDLIELYNAGDAAADLSGWKVAPDKSLPPAETYTFPPGSMLAPKQWLVLTAYDMVSGTGDFTFGLSQVSSETVALADKDGVLVDLITFDGVKAKVSFCRAQDGVGAWSQCEQTFGAKNVVAQTFCGDGKRNGMEACDGADFGGQNCVTLGVGYMSGMLACNPDCTLNPTDCKSGSTLVINEVESALDDIEIYNAGNAAVDLSGMILTDEFVTSTYNPALDTKKMIFVPGSTLGSKQFLVIKAGVGQNQHPFGLSANGDRVTLVQPDIKVRDAMQYGPGQASVSFCRVPDGPSGPWMPDCMATFGAPNKP